MAQDRTISALKLFTLERPAWTVEEIAAALMVSGSTAYRCVAVLAEAGLLTPGAGGSYTLGPAFIQYDRQIQITDPLLRAAKPVMADLLRFAPARSTVLLCRIFRETVLCAHQLTSPDQPAPVSYERGRPMPLFRGATSKIILAYLLPRDLRRIYETHSAEIEAAALGETWEAFRRGLAVMRKAGYIVTHAEVDAGRLGIGAPVFDDRGRILGSLSYVVPLAEQPGAARLGALVTTGGREISAALKAVGPASQYAVAAGSVQRPFRRRDHR